MKHQIIISFLWLGTLIRDLIGIISSQLVICLGFA